MSANVETSGFVGRVLGGRWVVGEQLGSGSFGVVHAGIERGTGAPVAIKMLHPQFLHHGETIARFANEAEALRRMNHQNVLVLLDFGVGDDGVPYLVTELLTGETLRELLNREGPLPPERAMRLLGPAAHALHHAHLLGIVHRDLKPENIFRVRKDGLGTTKILDFGVAKLLDTQPGKKLSQTGIMIGTMAYSPPEQMQGVGDIDHRADQFGFAAVMFEALTGQRPFPQSQPFALFQAVMTGPRPRASQMQPGLPPAIDDVLIRGLDPDRDRRYGNVEEFYLSFTHALTGTGAPSMTTTFHGGHNPVVQASAVAGAPRPVAHDEPSYVGRNPAPLGAPSRHYRPIDEEPTRGQQLGAPVGGPTTLMSAQAPRIVEASSALGTTLSEGTSPLAPAPKAPTYEAAPPTLQRPPPFIEPGPPPELAGPTPKPAGALASSRGSSPEPSPGGSRWLLIVAVVLLAVLAVAFGVWLGLRR
ncbi:MAG: hypothetical protein NVS3B10_24980 [Polyangiales bacterium]